MEKYSAIGAINRNITFPARLIRKIEVRRQNASSTYISWWIIASFYTNPHYKTLALKQPVSTLDNCSSYVKTILNSLLLGFPVSSPEPPWSISRDKGIPSVEIREPSISERLKVTPWVIVAMVPLNSILLCKGIPFTEEKRKEINRKLLEFPESITGQKKEQWIVTIASSSSFSSPLVSSGCSGCTTRSRILTQQTELFVCRDGGHYPLLWSSSHRFSLPQTFITLTDEKERN